MSNQDICLSISVPEEERNAIGNSRKAKACSCRHRNMVPLQGPGWVWKRRAWFSVSFLCLLQSFCMQISLRISMHSCSSPLLLNKIVHWTHFFWILLFDLIYTGQLSISIMESTAVQQRRTNIYLLIPRFAAKLLIIQTIGTDVFGESSFTIWRIKLWKWDWSKCINVWFLPNIFQLTSLGLIPTPPYPPAPISLHSDCSPERSNHLTVHPTC